MESADVQLSSKLTTSLKRISDTLILSQQQVGLGTSFFNHLRWLTHTHTHIRTYCIRTFRQSSGKGLGGGVSWRVCLKGVLVVLIQGT